VESFVEHVVAGVALALDSRLTLVIGSRRCSLDRFRASGFGFQFRF
jgi:hypothetical protein